MSNWFLEHCLRCLSPRGDTCIPTPGAYSWHPQVKYPWTAAATPRRSVRSVPT